eukprot:jgi/Chlat1/4310/Chrsp29S04479
MAMTASALLSRPHVGGAAGKESKLVLKPASTRPSVVPAPARHARTVRADAKNSGKLQKQPLKQKLFIPRTDKLADIALSIPVAILRLATGAFVASEVGSGTALPPKPIEIYEFEGCPFCRKVREAVNVLNLDVLFYPTPAGGPTYRPKVKEIGGKSQHPYMVDPNTGVSMYESDDIINYLFEKYGNGASVPFTLKLGALTALTAGIGLLFRMNHGSRYIPAKSAAKPLELWGYEASAHGCLPSACDAATSPLPISPFTKLVRETLSELELPHIMRTTPRGSHKRKLLKEKIGFFQVPYLYDPNTGVEMLESGDIVDYLNNTYKK